MDKDIKYRLIEDGIIFVPKRNNLFAVARVQQDTIVSQAITEKELEEADYFGKEDPHKEIKHFILILAESCIIVLIMYFIIKQNMILGLCFPFFLTGIVVFVNCCFQAYFERKNNPERDRLRSAAHMAINAFEELNRIPSLEEIKNYSSKYNFATINKIEGIIIHLLIIPGFWLIDNIYLQIILIILSFFLIQALMNIGKLNHLQRLDQLPPTDIELSIAIEALKVLKAIENDN